MEASGMSGERIGLIWPLVNKAEFWLITSTIQQTDISCVSLSSAERESPEKLCFIENVFYHFECMYALLLSVYLGIK